tara:strand:- start:7986 stop:8621 length:636 start_codon:yes stop_codon:yes gene_type:complete
MAHANSLLLFRNKLKSARSKEELERLTLEFVEIIGNRYKPLHILAEEGNEDVLQRLNFLLRVVEGSALDIGCFDGFYVTKLAEKGHNVIGLDMLHLCVDYATERVNGKPFNIKFVKGFAEDLPFDNNYFDTTILSHTLEHVFDDRLALREAVRVTKPQGKLIAIVPKSLGNDPTHLRHISSLTLQARLREYSTVSDELEIGNGIGYVGTIK